MVDITTLNLQRLSSVMCRVSKYGASNMVFNLLFRTLRIHENREIVMDEELGSLENKEE